MIRVRAAGVLLAVAAATLGAGCSQTGTAVKATNADSTVTTAKSTVKTPPRGTTVPDSGQVSSGSGETVENGPAQTGSISVRVWYGALNEVPMQNVTVRAQRISPCDPEEQYLPPTDAFIDRFEAKSDVNGYVSFTGISLGCYYVAADPVEGFTLEGSLDHGLFLTKSQTHIDAGLQFAKNNPECQPETFEELPYFSAGAEVQYCDGQWALVNANAPGDTARLLQREGSTWASYAAFPTNECRSAAEFDGVPSQYLGNFNQDC